MRKLLPITLLALVSIFLNTSCSEVPASATGEVAGGGLKFHHDFNSAMAESRQTGKPIVTVFSATWCPPCQAMKRDVYPSMQVAPFHNRFVWAYLDADNPQNQAIMADHQVEGIPHIAFISSTGAKLGKTVGSMNASDFANTLKGVLSRS